MLSVPRGVKLGITLIVIAIIVAISIIITAVIVRNSYDIKEIAGSKEPAGSDGGIEEGGDNKPLALKDKNLSQAIRDWQSLRKGDFSDDEFASIVAITVLLDSPMSKDIEDCQYEVKLVNNEWVTKFYCSGYDLYVTCDTSYYSPYMYTCTRKFTSEEKKFFEEIGWFREVTNEDGTYSIYYT